MQSDTHSADARALRRNVLLLAIAGSIGKFENQAVGIGSNDNRRLYRCGERNFNADVLTRVDDLDLFDIRRRDCLGNQGG